LKPTPGASQSRPLDSLDISVARPSRSGKRSMRSEIFLVTTVPFRLSARVVFTEWMAVLSERLELPWRGSCYFRCAVILRRLPPILRGAANLDTSDPVFAILLSILRESEGSLILGTHRWFQ